MRNILHENQVKKLPPFILSKRDQRENPKRLFTDAALRLIHNHFSSDVLKGIDKHKLYIDQFYKGVELIYEEFGDIDVAYFECLKESIDFLRKECSSSEEGRSLLEIYKQKAATIFQSVADHNQKSPKIVELMVGYAKECLGPQYYENEETYYQRLQKLYDDALQNTSDRFPYLKEAYLRRVECCELKLRKIDKTEKHVKERKGKNFFSPSNAKKELPLLERRINTTFLPKIETSKIVNSPFPFICNLPPRNEFFVGRELEISKLKEKLLKEKRGAITASITGLGGIGKTQLVQQYAHSFIHNYSVIWFFSCADLEDLFNSYLELASHLLDKNASVNIDEARKNKEKYLPVLRQLVNSRLKEIKHWLFIFDDVKSYDLIQDYLPDADVDGHVLITTRQKSSLPNQENYSNLETFNSAEAIYYLSSRLPNLTSMPSFREDALALCELLGYYPLALTLAAAYIEHHKITIKDYIEHFTQPGSSLLDQPVPDNLENKNLLQLKTVLKHTFVHLSSSAKEILYFCAYLDSYSIPKKFLELFFPDLQELGTALAELNDYSLIRYGTSGKFFTIHRLVQSYTQLILKKSGSQDIILTKVVTCLVQGVDLAEANEENNLKEYKLLLPHIKNVVEHISSLSTDSEVILKLTLTERYAMVLLCLGKFNDSLQYSMQVLDVLSRINNDNKAFTSLQLFIYVDIAVAHAGLKNYGEADDYYQKIRNFIKENKLDFSNKRTPFLLKKIEYLEKIHHVIETMGLVVLKLASSYMNLPIPSEKDVLERNNLIEKSQKEGTPLPSNANEKKEEKTTSAPSCRIM